MPESKGSPTEPLYLRYLSALLLTALATAARAYLIGQAGSRFNYTPFVIAVILACWYGGFGPALVTTVLGLVVGLHYAADVAGSRPGGYLIVSLIIVVAMNAQRR